MPPTRFDALRRDVLESLDAAKLQDAKLNGAHSIDTELILAASVFVALLALIMAGGWFFLLK